MKSNLQILAVILGMIAGSCQAQVNVLFNLGTLTYGPVTNREVIVVPYQTPIQAPPTLGLADSFDFFTDGNGDPVTISNVMPWTYQVTIPATYASSLGGDTTFYINVPTNAGTWNALSLLTNAPPAPATNYLTASQTYGLLQAYEPFYAGSGVAIAANPGSNVISVVSSPVATNGPDGRNLAGMVDTNIYYLLSLGYTVVAPVTNYPAATANPYYYCPLDGSNYIQQAVNSLPNYGANRTWVGGGNVVYVLPNYAPTTVLVTNVGGGIMNDTFQASFFCGGGIVCATNPALRVEGYNRGVNFDMYKMIIASLVNQKTNLIEFGESSIGTGANIGNMNVDDNWFGYWPYLTNNSDTYGWAGLTTPTTGGQIGQHNLNLSIDNANSDYTSFDRNHLIGMQSVYWSPDHGEAIGDFFSYCGGSYAQSGSSATAWTNGIYDLGAAFILGNTALNENNWDISDLHFYGCYAGYYSQTTTTHIVRNTYFEGYNIVSELGSNPEMDGVYYSELSPFWPGQYGYSSPPALAITNGANSLLPIPPNVGNSDGATFKSIPWGYTLQGGDQNSIQTIGDVNGGYLGVNGNGVFSNLDLAWQIVPAPNTVLFETVQPQDNEGEGGAHDPITFVNLNGIQFNADGSINLQDMNSGTALNITGTNINASVPFKGSFIGNATYATNAGTATAATIASGLVAGTTVTNVTDTNAVIIGAVVPTNAMASFAGPMLTTNGQGQVVPDNNGNAVTNLNAGANNLVTNGFNTFMTFFGNSITLANGITWISLSGAAQTTSPARGAEIPVGPARNLYEWDFMYYQSVPMASGNNIWFFPETNAIVDGQIPPIEVFGTTNGSPTQTFYTNEYFLAPIAGGTNTFGLMESNPGSSFSSQYFTSKFE